jgi:hypothetical protein
VTSDRRLAIRRRTILGASIIFNSKSSTLDCVIRDLSDTGAKLKADGIATLPDEFTLEVPCKRQSYPVRVVWRRADTCGVRFQAAP